MVEQYKSTEAPASTGVEAVVQHIVHAYARHKAAWSSFAPRIDRYFENYAKNYWAREWYSGSPNLLMHTVQLLARMVVLRFMLFGHPALAAAIDADVAAKEAALDRAAVETVQKFSRAFEHQASFMQSLAERLTNSNMVSLAPAVCLAKF